MKSEDGTGSRRPLLGDAGIVTPPDSQRKGRCRNAAVFFAKSLPIAVSELFGSGLALSVGLAPASSPKGGALGMSVSFRLDERSTISRKR